MAVRAPDVEPSAIGASLLLPEGLSSPQAAWRPTGRGASRNRLHTGADTSPPGECARGTNWPDGRGEERPGKRIGALAGSGRPEEPPAVIIDAFATRHPQVGVPALAEPRAQPWLAGEGPMHRWLGSSSVTADRTPAAWVGWITHRGAAPHCRPRGGLCPPPGKPFGRRIPRTGRPPSSGIHLLIRA